VLALGGSKHRPPVKVPPPHGGPSCDHGNGGRGGGSGAPGGGGAGGAPQPVLCTGTPPASPLLTSFSGLASPYTYVAPGLQAPTASPLAAADGSLLGLDVSANPGATTDAGNAWLGVGVALGGCVDASAYNGIRFTISGDLGTCSLAFVGVPAEQSPVMYGGTCADASCWSPTSAPFGTGVNVVHFADLVGGNPPGAVDPARLLNVQWQLGVPTDGVTAPCVAHFTITDVAFTNN
jgi:hypothetical protein